MIVVGLDIVIHASALPEFRHCPWLTGSVFPITVTNPRLRRVASLSQRR
jgi:hypothetical protein